MSRIGKKVINVPAGTKVDVKEQVITEFIFYGDDFFLSEQVLHLRNPLIIHAYDQAIA